jgi:hypothetical protein
MISVGYIRVQRFFKFFAWPGLLNTTARGGLHMVQENEVLCYQLQGLSGFKISQKKVCINDHNVCVKALRGTQRRDVGSASLLGEHKTVQRKPLAHDTL